MRLTEGASNLLATIRSCKSHGNCDEATGRQKSLSCIIAALARTYSERGTGRIRRQVPHFI